MALATTTLKDGPDHHSISYSLWSGWPVQATLAWGRVDLYVHEVAMVKKDTARIAGLYGKYKEHFEALINVNPHSPMYRQGEITIPM